MLFQTLPNPGRIAATVDDGAYEYSAFQKFVENSEWKPFGQKTVIVFVRLTMDPTVDETV